MNPEPLSADAGHLRRLARQYLDAGRTGEAKAVLEALVRQVPHDVPARMELAGVLLREGRVRAATGLLVQSVPFLPNHAPLIGELAWRLSAIGEVLAARACVEHLERAPDPPGWLLAEQAHLRWTLGEIPAARARMDRAVAAGVDSPREHYVNAMLHQFTGQFAAAEAVLLETLRRWPDYGDAAVILANLRKQTADSNHLDFLAERLARLASNGAGTRTDLARAKFESAISKVLDDLGRYDQAWEALARSNALMHALFPYDADGEAAVTDALIDASRRVAEGNAVSPPRFEGPMPIFIVGMPRSGTTLLDHMLSAHTKVVSAGEIGDFQRQLHWVADVAPATGSLLKVAERIDRLDFAELGARYLKQTQWRAPPESRYYIDKLPINVRMVPFIRRALPRAPILHLVRDPMDVCYSNLKIMFGSASPYCYDMRSLAHYHGLYVRLADCWRTTMPDAMLDVSYASLVNDPADTLRGVLEHCGLAIEDDCLHPERNAAPVATPSGPQVREPVHGRGLGAWRQYAGQLEPLRLALQEMAKG